MTTKTFVPMTSTSTTATSTFADELKRRRADHNLTQGQLSIKTGIRRCTIAAYESGRIEPSLCNFLKIVRALEINICYYDTKSVILANQYPFL